MLVALTKTVELLIPEGAVKFPLSSIVPSDADHVTAVKPPFAFAGYLIIGLLVLVTVTVSCTVCPGAIAADPGLTEILTGDDA